MANNTTNYNLVKPSENEYYDINVSNSNLDIIDTEIKKINDRLDSVSTDAQSTSFDNSSNGMEATNVQDAIEENKESIEANKTSIQTLSTNITKLQNADGDLSQLQTTNKSNLVGAINELFQNVSNGKSSIANAITDKGVSASGSDTFSTLASKIGQISTGKKWATGTALTSGRRQNFTSQNGYTSSQNVLDIPMPNFRPNTLFYIGKNSNSFGIISNINADGLRYKPYLLYIDSFDIDTNTTDTYCYSLKADSIVFNGNVISVPVYLSNTGAEFTWIAFE